jgi:hypothetical protein
MIWLIAAFAENADPGVSCSVFQAMSVPIPHT